MSFLECNTSLDYEKKYARIISNGGALIEDNMYTTLLLSELSAATVVTPLVPFLALLSRNSTKPVKLQLAYELEANCKLTGSKKLLSKLVFL